MVLHLVWVFLLSGLAASLEWVPVAPARYFQNYINPPLQVMTPPATTPIWVKFTPQLHQPDFAKPKTQSFYKATLLPAQPPVYEFRYKVHDPKEENYQEKSETRVGDSVRGYYSVREPDGYVRLVRYVSDENGFKTHVSHHYADDDGGRHAFAMTRHLT